MNDKQAGDPQVFLLPRDKNRYYLYSPLRRSVAVINGAAVNAVARYLQGQAQSLTADEADVLRTLKEQGVIGDTHPDPPTFPEDYSFCPHEVTLFPTSRCNLRCRYCYADAGKKSVDMSWEIAQAAIDLVSTNAGLLGSEKFAVGFHGGGEATLAWNLLVRAVEYAHERAEQLGLDVEVFAATNGLLSSKKREYIAGRFTTVNVSLDGPEDIQDYNRPRADGRGSFREVAETLKYFDDAGLRYGIRATVTARTVDRVEEIIENLHEQFAFEYLHIEPAWYCGRCITTGEGPPSDERFIESFLKAAQKARELGINLHYSGARIDTLTSKFCAAPGDGFTVLPEGIVTSCYEITDLTDSRSGIFHYGRYDSQTKGYIFDEERLESLRQLSVENLSYCRNCFCKWHCAGDCLAKVFEKSGSAVHGGSVRCELNRALTLHSLDEIVLTAEKSRDSDSHKETS